MGDDSLDGVRTVVAGDVEYAAVVEGEGKEAGVCAVARDGVVVVYGDGQVERVDVLDVGEDTKVVGDVDVGTAVDQGVRRGDSSGIVDDAADTRGARDP
jgi:hypothetical protein